MVDPLHDEASVTARSGITFDCLPGYNFLECVGRSPFGESWRVRAPDEQLRAVKFVTSFCNREAAITSRELSAAVRLKHIRHPGLVRVERIENLLGELLVLERRRNRMIGAALALLALALGLAAASRFW